TRKEVRPEFGSVYRTPTGAARGRAHEGGKDPCLADRRRAAIPVFPGPHAVPPINHLRRVMSPGRGAAARLGAGETRAGRRTGRYLAASVSPRPRPECRHAPTALPRAAARRHPPGRPAYRGG